MRRSPSTASRRCRPITSELEIRGFEPGSRLCRLPGFEAHHQRIWGCGEGTAMITIRHETPFDVARRDALLNAAFGDCRFTKTAERLRERLLPAVGLSFVDVADQRLSSR